MDADDDSLHPPSDASPPLPLKRLKRALSRTSDGSDPPEIPHAPGEDGLDPLFGDGGQFTGCEAGNLEQPAVRAEGEGGESPGRKKKSTKKRLCLDGEEEKDGKKRRRRKGSGDPDGDLHKESVREKRRLEKERQAYLEQLHAESQRLLRETKNASFKSAPPVQKPISSVLEKIRLRKLEMLKKSNEFYDLESPAENETCENSNLWAPVVSCSQSGKKDNSENAEELQETDFTPDKTDADAVEALDSPSGNKHHESVLDSNYEDVHYGPTVGLKDSLSSPVKYEDKIRSGKQVDSSQVKASSQENNVSSLPTTNPNSGADLSDGTSSDDEDYNKENDDPVKTKPSCIDLFKRADLAKSFVDDEAEEEDDSDHDILRFPEEDEEEDSEDNDGIDDLIATAYKEMPADQERRNQLHQQWLEQQDAAETNNVLQRLKRQQRKGNDQTTIPDENSSEELDEGTDDDSLLEDLPANSARQNSKRAKQMMAQMFDAKDDGFVSSDDEETEHRLSRERILEQTERHTLVLSSEDNANSKEVFSLIKKLNIAPDPKKKPGPASVTYEPLHLCGNSNSSSKTSFLGRATSNSLPSSHKQSNATFKSYVFGRDDSNSRSATPKPEDLPDTNQTEALHPRTGSAKFTGSQSKSISSKSDQGSNASGSSLFQILRRSSAIYDQQFKAPNKRNLLVSETQAAQQLTAFKLRSHVPKRSMPEASVHK